MKISLDKYTFLTLLSAIKSLKPTSKEMRMVYVTYYTMEAWVERVRNKHLGIIPDQFTIKISIAEAHALLLVSEIHTVDPWLIASLEDLRGVLAKYIAEFDQRHQPFQEPLKRLA